MDSLRQLQLTITGRGLQVACLGSESSEAHRVANQVKAIINGAIYTFLVVVSTLLSHPLPLLIVFLDISGGFEIEEGFTSGDYRLFTVCE